MRSPHPRRHQFDRGSTPKVYCPPESPLTRAALRGYSLRGYSPGRYSPPRPFHSRLSAHTTRVRRRLLPAIATRRKPVILVFRPIPFFRTLCKPLEVINPTSLHCVPFRGERFPALWPL